MLSKWEIRIELSRPPLASTPIVMAIILALVTARVRFVPAPRCFDDRFDGCVVGRPVEQLAGEPCVGDEFRRVAGTAGRDNLGNRMDGDLAARIDHFTDAVAAPRAQVYL